MTLLYKGLQYNLIYKPNPGSTLKQAETAISYLRTPEQEFMRHQVTENKQNSYKDSKSSKKKYQHKNNGGKKNE